VIARLAPIVDPDRARDDVRGVLDDRRFHNDPAPRPFRGPLEWLGDRLAPIGRWIADVAGAVPWFVWLTIVLAVTAGFVAWMLKRAQRTGSRRAADGTHAGASAVEDPTALERAADEAERNGDLDRAVRLRFRAGLLRLGTGGAIAYGPSVTTSEVRAALGSETFDDLAETFEHVAYGGRRAAAPDVEAAREAWPRVLEQARRR
jgi:hypothetical protein